MLTLNQLYKLGVSVDTDIFSGLTLPDNSPLNRTTLINTIMEHCGLNTPLYADVSVMQSAITLWSAKNQYTFEHVGKIYLANYSPIENKDYYVDNTVVHSRDMTDNTATTANKGETLNSSVNENKTSTHSGTDTNTEEQTTSAFNSNTYQPADKTTTTLQHGEVITDAGTGQTATTKSTTGSTSNAKTVDEDENTTTTSHEHGNIGITSNNQLQEMEYSMLSKYNPYNFLSGLFENDLTIFLY